MNKKMIKKVLSGKLNDWVNSIEDLHVRSLVRNNTIITGGAIASMLLNEEVKDFDVYFRNKETALAVAKWYVKKFNADNECNAFVITGEELENDDKYSGSFLKQTTPPGRIRIVVKSNGVASEKGSVLDEPFEDVYDALPPQTEGESETKKAYRPIFLSPNAITLSDKIQIVIRFYGEAYELHENYDFIHCTNSWTSWNNEVNLVPEAMEALLAKQLVYIGSKYPLCSVIRTRKFIKRGFHIDAGQYLKMLFQVSQLDLKDINVLEDQLVGVDSAYFGILINALRVRSDADAGFSVNESYLISLIDRIF